MNCPNCGSPDLVRLALLHERGTMTTRSSGIGYGRNETVFVTSTATTQTATAQRAAPPTPKTTIVWTVLWFIYVPIPALMGLGAVAFAFGTRSAGRIESLFMAAVMLSFAGVVHWIIAKQFARVKRYNNGTYQQQVREWQSQYQCNRCGVVAIPAVGGAGARITNDGNPAIEG